MNAATSLAVLLLFGTAEPAAPTSESSPAEETAEGTAAEGTVPEGTAADASPADETAAQPAATRLRILTLPLDSGVLDEESLSLVDGRIAIALATDANLDVVTREDIQRIMELEAERAMLGCDDSGCLADIAGAMGADLVTYGRVSELDGRYILQLNSFRATTSDSGPRREVDAGSVGVLSERAPIAAQSIIAELRGEDSTMLFPEEPASGGAAGLVGITGLAVLGTGAVTAAAGLGLGFGGAALFFDPASATEKQLGQNITRVGAATVAVGSVLLVAGAGAAVTSLLLE